MDAILNLIFGLFITIILTIIYVISNIVEYTMYGASNIKSRSGRTDNRQFKNNQRDRSGGSMSSALDFMSDALGYEPAHGGIDVSADTSTDNVQSVQSVQSIQFNGRSDIHSNPPDFPIDDPELKAAYTAAFLEVYGSTEKPPVVKYDDIKKSLKYIPRTKLYTSAYHIGQRKLILNEIQFLTRIPSHVRGLVVYAGAAPSNKGALLASLFPNLKFLLIDPAEFDIRPYRSIEIRSLDGSNSPADLISSAISELETADICTARVLMSAGIAEELGKMVGRSDERSDKNEVKKSGQTKSKDSSKNEVKKSSKNTHFTSNLYFMSDIRTNMESDMPTTLDLLWNSAQHIQWVQLMKPRESMLKFRTPYFSETPEELAEYEKKSHLPPYAEAFDAVAPTTDLRTFTSRKFEYFDGEIFIQPWAPVSSTEARLVFAGVPTLREYDPVDYEDKFFYYNKILRSYQICQNPNSDRALGFDHCADCSLENKIWTDYCVSRGFTGDLIRDEVHHYVKTLADLTYRPLLHGEHGHLFSTIPLPKLEEKIRGFTSSQKSKSKYNKNQKTRKEMWTGNGSEESQ